MPTVTVEQALRVALEHQQNGRLDEAEGLFRQVLEHEANNTRAMSGLSILLFNRGYKVQAAALMQRVIELDRNSVEAHHHLGEMLFACERYTEAAGAYRRACELRPDLPECHLSLGASLLMGGDAAGALPAFEAAARLRPSEPLCQVRRGDALRKLNRFDEAMQAYASALAQRPALAEALAGQANIERRRGSLTAAHDLCRRALAADGNCAEAYQALGDVLLQRGELTSAADAYNQCIARRRIPEAHNSLGIVLRQLHRNAEALDCFQAAVLLGHGYPEATANTAMMLAEQGLLHQALDLYRQAIQRKPTLAPAHSSLLYSLHLAEWYDARMILDEHVQWAKQHADPLAGEIRPIEIDRAPDLPLRVGFVSPDFREHSVAWFILPLLLRLDRNAVRVVCYSDVTRPDVVTEQVRSLADEWRDTTMLDDAQLAERIRADRIDILIDLTGHLGTSRLLAFARRPAPVQVTYLGYPGTTGLRTMNWRLSDDIADPPGESDATHTEKLWRLPGGFLCFAPIADSPPVSALPAERNGHITFGCFNNFVKVSPRMRTAWARILAAVPGSRLLVKSQTFGDGPVRARIHDLLFRYGIPPQRVEVLGRDPSIASHLERYHRIDIALDTFPYNGTTTTFEALWMGVPVVTLRGQRHASRVGADILARAGLQALIADEYEGFERCAIELARDIDRLKRLRAELRGRIASSPMMDPDRLAREFADALRGMWRQATA